MVTSREIRKAIDRLIEAIPPRPPAEAAAVRQRWLRLSGRDTPAPDYLPLIVTGYEPSKPDRPDELWPGTRQFALAEQMADPEKMLYHELLRLVTLRRFPGDGELAAFPRFGNAFLLTVLGLEVRVIDNTVWPAEHRERDAIGELFVPDDLSSAGLMPDVLRFVDCAKSLLPDHIAVGLYFMMSPFDLAYLVRGPDMLVDMFDAPDCVHRLMDVCTELFLRATRLLKEAVGEPDAHYHYQAMTYAGGGQLCEDCCVMISPQQHEEFCIPYTRRALDAMAGGWVHFCGDGRQILDNYLAIANLHGVQFGQVHLNGPIADTVRKVAGAGKALNAAPRAKGESWPDCFRRLLDPLEHRKGLYATAHAPVGDGSVGERLQTMWHEAQDRAFAG